MSKITVEDRIFTMSELELQTFPLGIIQLDRSGTIIYYNEAEAVLAHRTAAATVGLNFFTDVAPCTAVQNFQGRFNGMFATREDRCEKFEFIFRFAWGDKKVGITMVRRIGDDDRTYIVVNATNLAA